MQVRRRFPLMNEAGAGGGGGGAAGAGAPGGDAGAGGAAGGGSGAGDGANDSLLKQPPAGGAAGAGAAGEGSADELAWLPEKYRVNGTDGKLDLQASSKKLGEGYGNLAKRLGAPPAKAEDYQFQVPAGLAEKGVQLDAELSGKFRELAHKNGLSQAQYQAVVEASFDMVPAVLDGALKLSAEQARQELSKVWKSPADFDAGLNDAQRAVDAAPEAVRQDIWARYGRDPQFLQFAAAMGKEMREDKSAVNRDGTTGASGGQAVEDLMKSEAYRNPKHADHARVSEQVRQHYERVHGSAAAM